MFPGIFCISDSGKRSGDGRGSCGHFDCFELKVLGSRLNEGVRIEKSTTN